MESSSYIVLINSVLLSVSSTAFLIIGFFLKDLYADYKKQVERTNQMHAELNIHVKLFQELTQIFQSQMEEMQKRIVYLEKKHHNE